MKSTAPAAQPPKVFTHKDFVRIGQRLEGPSWIGALAKALKVHRRTVERYADGSARIPDKIRRALGRLIAQRLEDLGEDFDLCAA